MENRVSDLRCKEVVNVSDGARLGFVSDVEVELPCGRVTALIVPGPCKYLFCREYDYFLPWGCVRRIGGDIILVDIKPEDARLPRPKFSFQKKQKN